MVTRMERRMNKPLKRKTVQMTDSLVLSLQHPLIQCCPECGVTVFGNILGAIYRISYKLAQSSLGIKVIFYSYFTKYKYHVTSVTLHLHHQWYPTKGKNKP